MQKATEDLRNEAQKKQEAKKRYLDDNVKQLPDLHSQNEAFLVSLAKELHKKIAEAEEHRYDMEIKIRKHDYEV